MLLLRSPFLVASFCSVSRLFKFLPVSPMKVAWQPGGGGGGGSTPDFK